MTTIQATRHAAAMKANRSRRRAEEKGTPKSKHASSNGFLTMSAHEQARRLSLLSATVRQKLLKQIIPWVDALRKGSSNGRGSR